MLADITHRKQAEQKLQESEGRYKAFFNSSAVGTAEIDLTGRFTNVNASFCQITGYSHEELLRMNVVDLSYLDNRDNDSKLLADYLSGKTPTFDFEKRYVRKDSKVIWVQVTAALVRDTEGNPLRSMGVIQDISERKKIEEELRKSEEQYRTLFNKMNEGFCIIKMLFDENEKPIDYIFVEANPAFEMQTGLSNVVGQRVRELIPANEDYWYEIYGKVALTGESVRFENRVKELNRWYEVYAYRIGQPENRKVAILFNDFTEHKLMGEQIRQRAEELEMIMEAAPVAIWIGHDPQSHNITGNRMANEFYEAGNGEDVSANVTHERHFFHKGCELTADELPMQQASLKDIDVRNVDLDVLLPSGKWRTMMGSASPLHDGDGNVRGSVGTFIDITERKKIEEALQESEERFRTMANAIPQLAWIARADGYTHWYNKRWYAYTGTTPEQMEGWGWQSVHDQAVLPKVLEQWQASLATGQPFDMEFPLRGADGIFRPFLTRVLPLKDANGKILQWFGTNTDISELKKMENTLKIANENLEEKIKERTAELERAYSSLKEIESDRDEAQKIAHIGNWQWNIVTNEIHWSDEVYRIFGLKPKEFEATFDEYFKYVHPEDRTYINNAIKMAFEGEKYSVDNRIMTATGEDRIVHTDAEIIFNENYIPVYARGIVQDITERKKAEEELKESEERFRNLFKAISSGVAIYDVVDDGRDFIFKDMNPAGEHIDNVRREDIIGKSLFELFPNVGEMGLDTAFRRVWRTGKPEFFPLTIYKDSRISLWVTNYIYRLPSGELVVIFDDITEKKRAEQSLAEMEIARKQEIHHRIKNNLQVISSLLDLQAEQFRGKKHIKDSEFLEAFKESQDRVISMALIHEELHNSGDMNTIKISKYIEELTDNLFLTYRLGNENTRLIKNIEEDVFFNMDVSVPLGLIINELISNSFKYAFVGRDTGEIQIKLHREENGEYTKGDCNITAYTLSVSDNGIGIPEELDFEDLGSLGLQLVVTLVEQLDGKLEVKRNNGTEFIIKFTVTEKSNQVSEPALQIIE